MKKPKHVEMYRPTASRFGDILTPGGKPSKASSRYIDDIIRWSLDDTEEETFSSYWTERGKKLENEATREYAKKMGIFGIFVPPFTFNKKYLCGCYLDGQFSGGCIEIKCLKQSNHKKILIGGVPLKFKPQLQGSLLVTGFAFIDFVAYCPGEDVFIERILIDHEYREKMIVELEIFNKSLEDKYNNAKNK